MSTAIHSVKVAALKGAEIKLTVRSLEKGVTVSFCPILALRLLSALGASTPVDRADFVDAHASPGERRSRSNTCCSAACFAPAESDATGSAPVESLRRPHSSLGVKHHSVERSMLPL